MVGRHTLTHKHKRGIVTLSIVRTLRETEQHLARARGDANMARNNAFNKGDLNTLAMLEDLVADIDNALRQVVFVQHQEFENR